MKDPYRPEDEPLELREETSTPQPPKPMLWIELNAKEFPEQQWRIKNLIPKQGSVILSSISGEKKTWVALEMARCISMGEDFLGNPDFKTEGCSVLYVNCENPESEMQRRGRQLGFPEQGPNDLYILNMDDLNLNDEEWAEWFIRDRIVRYGVQVVVLDTFRAVSGGLKEEKAEEIRQFFKRFGALKNQGVCLVWLDHFRKPSNFDGKVPKKEHLLGSQDKTASTEILLMLRSESGTNEISVYQRKNRLAKEQDPFHITMTDEYVEGIKRTFLKYAGELEDQENKKEMAKELIIGILESSDGKLTKELIEMTRKEVGAKNVRAALKELVAEKLIDTVKRARENYYFLPKEGQNPVHEDKDAFF